MKRLLLTLIFSLVSLVSHGQPGWNDAGNLRSTNIVMVDSSHTNVIIPGALNMYGRAQAIISMHSSPSGGAYGTQNGELSLYYDNGIGNGGFFFDTNVFISGDLIVSGNVSAATNILWTTNLVYATNSTYATNDQWGNVLAGTNVIYTDTNLFKLAQGYYPTNDGTRTVDFTVPYADVQFTSNGWYWYYPDSTKFSTTNYQTAVRILHSSLGTTNVFGFPGPVRIFGTPSIKNETICTWFYNPNVPETNLYILPVW